MSTPSESPAFNRSAAITRSLLGWGVVAGPFYVVLGLSLALTRPGFRLPDHALSLLMLGEWGWLQRVNLILSALMVLAAAIGFLRAIRNGRGLAIAVLTMIYAASLILSAIFPPDPVNGFPVDLPAGTVSTSGILHMLFGAIGFVAIASASFAYADWARSVGSRPRATAGIVLGVVVIVGFFAGAALSLTAVGTALLWIAVLAGWTWLAIASAHVYAWTPHPFITQKQVEESLA